MTVPRWTTGILKRVVPPDRIEDVLGDLEEAHRRRIARRGKMLGTALTSAEAIDIAFTLLVRRLKRRRTPRKRPSHRQPGKARIPFPVSWIDFKLGVRMLVKYPTLTVTGVLALAFAIAIGIGTFVFMLDAVHPTLPDVPDGDRLVEIQYRDVANGGSEPRTVYDFRAWRGRLTSVTDLSAARTTIRNLAGPDGRTEPVRGAEMTASSFRATGVRPLLGRVPVASDGAIGAQPVMVLGYDVWQRRFDGDEDIVGRLVRYDADWHTVIGIMPEGFAFPYGQEAWTPLQLGATEYGPRQGPRITLFGRIADGASLSEVTSETSALFSSAATAYPAMYETLRLQVQPFGSVFLSGDVPFADIAVYSANALFFLTLLGLISANIALLVFARTATRESEIAVRSALGAGRRRIVMQLFVEALVLGIVAMIVGLVAGNIGLGWVIDTFDRVEGAGSLPYWFHSNLTPTAVLYAGVFTVVAAVMIGVLPALKATGRGVQARLQNVAARGSSLRMGGVWTLVIVMQVALTVFFVRLAIEIGVDMNEIRTANFGVAADEYLTARIAMAPPTDTQSADTTRSDASARFYPASLDLATRLATEPGVRDVTFAAQAPGKYHRRRRIEVEDLPILEGNRGDLVQTGTVDEDFFDVLNVPVVAGRHFTAADIEAGAKVVIVNESFVRFILDDRNAVGRRFRYLNADRRSGEVLADEEPEPWYEVVGVIRDVAMTVDPDLPHNAGLYHLLTPADGPPLRMIIHQAGVNPMLAAEVRSVAASVNPALRVEDVIPLSETNASLFQLYDAWFRVLIMFCGLAVILSNAGIYAVMSFAVSRRTREIGVRIALGASAQRIITAIVSRSLVQILLGLAIGSGVLVALGAVRWSAGSVTFFATYISAMMAVCLLSCVVPTRRALKIEPTEALKQE